MFRCVQLDQALRLTRQHAGNVRAVSEEPVREIDSIRPARRQVFLVTLPTQAGLDQLISNHLAGCILGRRNRLYPVDIDVPWNALYFVCAVECGCGRVGPHSRNRANVRAGRIVGVHCARSKIGRAVRIVPVWVVIAVHTKIRGAHNFQIVGRTGMRNRKVVGGQIR